MFAHVGGVPVEEALLPLVSWASAALLLARGWLVSRCDDDADRRPTVSSGQAMDFRPSLDLCS